MLPKDKSLLPHINYMHYSISEAWGPLGWWLMGVGARPALLLGFVWAVCRIGAMALVRRMVSYGAWWRGGLGFPLVGRRP